MHIHYFQHAPFEGLACIEDWAAARGHTLSATRWYNNPAPPAAVEADMLIVMGGPMGVYEEDQYAWLAPEKELIRGAIAAGKPVLGICLGAQLIAAALGAKVYPNREKEIGWFPVQFHEDLAPSSATVFHWHGDTFDLPEGAVHLAETPACKNQAYRIGDKVYGLQFHFEVTPAAMESMLQHLGHELQPAAYVQTADDIRAGARFAADNNVWMQALLNRLEKLV
ncbi:gamma-glutamyl-gamma-aminobutyrate hydrolase family protein [Chitinophaga sp.]|uniref:type 1 glutamine amidotransferase n=1 Tax=Chitinophaga sp. TaxID=1869181 RepID=UPI0031DB6053